MMYYCRVENSFHLLVFMFRTFLEITYIRSETYLGRETQPIGKNDKILCLCLYVFVEMKIRNFRCDTKKKLKSTSTNCV